MKTQLGFLKLLHRYGRRGVAMNRIEKLRSFIIENRLEGFSAFNRRNATVGNTIIVYNEDNITVGYCYHYEYLEIIGLSNEEYNSLKDILKIH